MDEDYIWENIRTLLNRGFTDEELRQFCHDEPAFQPVYYRLTQYSSKTDIVDLIIGHAERQLIVEILLKWAKRNNSVRYEKHKPYTYSDKDEEWVKVPLRGYITAGKPIMLFKDSYDGETYKKVPRKAIPKNVTPYALNVKGTSMIDAMVNDGDTVIVDEAKNFDPNGKMVIIRLIEEEETTLKIFYNEGNRIRLQPKNETFKPIYTDLDNVDIQGRVIAVIPGNQSDRLIYIY